MNQANVSDNFYDRIKPRLYKRVGRELRLAYRVLDLGCGTCELVQHLSETYGQKATGVDISTNGFPNKKSIAKNIKGVRCIRKDAAQLGFIQDGTIDAAIIFWALHEMKKPQAILQETHRVLRPGGEVLVVEFPRNSLAKELWNENYFTIKELTGFLRRSGFESVRAKKIEHKQILWVTGFCDKN
jgi:ubiquinone/menaquinone biosynthesis C-methylase UbiE